MLTKQDIAVLSDLLDQGLHPIKEDLQMLHKEFIGLNNKFNGLRQDMNEKIDGLREEMHNEISSLRKEIHAEIRDLREEMRSEIRRLDQKIDKTQRDLDEVKTMIRTDISPRLKTIEDCYLKTFERYYESAERQEKMEEDVSVMKDVIQEHSAQLQKLCS